MTPTIEGRNLEYKKAVGSDEPITPQVSDHVTQIDGGIVDYVRRQMHCETVTQEVRRQAAAFEREMSRM